MDLINTAWARNLTYDQYKAFAEIKKAVKVASAQEYKKHCDYLNYKMKTRFLEELPDDANK